MIGRIQSEISQFKESLARSQAGAYRITQVCEYGFMIQPPDSLPLPHEKEIGLMLMAASHGNEVGGIAVLNELLWLLNQGSINLKFNLGVVLANPLAALSQKRYVDRDLNRSFGRTNTDDHEDKRARELEGFLQKTCYLVDIHQTIEGCATPFFIFPYQQQSLVVARNIGPRIPVVTHWGKGFSKDGQCADEFVNGAGGCGLTLELGQSGFGAYQVALGLQCILRAHDTVADSLRGVKLMGESTRGELYTWGQIVPFLSGDSSLDQGWENFKDVFKGQRLGIAGGKELKALCDGKMLFPKYMREEGVSRPAELCRIICPVSREMLEEVDVSSM